MAGALRLETWRMELWGIVALAIVGLGQATAGEPRATYDQPKG